MCFGLFTFPVFSGSSTDSVQDTPLLLSVGHLPCRCTVSHPSLCWQLSYVMGCQMHFYGEMSLFAGLELFPGLLVVTGIKVVNTAFKLKLLWTSVVQLLHQRSSLCSYFGSVINQHRCTKKFLLKCSLLNSYVFKCFYLRHLIQIFLFSKNI